MIQIQDMNGVVVGDEGKERREMRQIKIYYI
jgi:hypothetical protein